ncbi:TaqI-like C-terminal specificity domain-containing protein, partial [Ornithobacterium rhinotracheale]|uniref:TaqI-like C-terminal specificity domain-containing protein n=1 Tax=Ornithobacterium rhinotracheale TaxID=28251 RepID=UPI0040363147
EAFIINGEKKDELIAQDPKSAEIIRPLLRGRDIKRYSYEFADLYLICTFPSLKIDIEEYPAVKEHLLSFGKERLEQSGKTHEINGKRIKSRKKTNNKWFETQDSISYWEDFYKQKIMYSEIVREPQFYLDETGKFYPEATTFIMTGSNIEYLYHLLNSNVVTYFFKEFYAGGGLGNEGYRYKKVFLEKLPIPKNTLNIEVSEINIDNYLYNLYGFTDEEIKFLNEQFK